MSKTIVVSAVNLRKGGTLTILRQCLAYLSQQAGRLDWRVVALVHRRELADYPNIEYIELPWSIKGWGKRLWCEYVTMGRLSRQIGEIDLWLSLHDTTPRVQAKRQAVYCQTSFPFMRWRLSDFRFDVKIPLFAMFTRLAYRIGIHRNRYLVVQQEWLRQGFSEMFGIAPERFIVAPPPKQAEVFDNIAPVASLGLYTFIYAATPDSHKNFETLCLASERLEQVLGQERFRVLLTISGDENKYASWLKARWGHVKSLEFIGLQPRESLFAYYASADCMVFPSRIETWGLPISEFVDVHGGVRPLLLADLPYAHNTAAGAHDVGFFPPCDAEGLAQLMHERLDGYRGMELPKKIIAQPMAHDWDELFILLLA